MPSTKSPADELRIETVAVGQITPNPRNPRTHSKSQIRQIAESMRAFGCTSPVVIDENNILIAGHGRLAAAKLLGLKTIMAIVVSGLSDAKKRALALADNKIPQNAGWDLELLAAELESLQETLISEGLDMSITAFEPAEIDALRHNFEHDSSDPPDDVDPSHLLGPEVTRQNDLWQLTGIVFFAAMRAVPTR
jgi:ParB-like chromosome segregation protein Spo0J